MKEKIEKLKKEFLEEIKKIDSFEQLENVRIKYLGKKGLLSILMQDFRKLPAEEKKEYGKPLNLLKNKMTQDISNKKQELEEKQLQDTINKQKKIDITLPVGRAYGSLHPVTITGKQVEDVFTSMGFYVEDGPEIVDEYDNFEAVNIPKNHPARDMQDTFWLKNGDVLKTHTSASQNRILKKHSNKLEKGENIKAIFPGRCFRNESLDSTHENTFFQLEGILVGQDISVSNLIYFMKKMLEGVFKKDLKVRLRPGYFPFVEPGFELDVSCPFCEGKGCSVCKKSGWIELCPCGMIHTNVLENANINSEKYNGFAFGLGLTRLVMLKYKLNEIRHLNSGNLKILKQFKTR
ncbi:MAG: phenylalanine--tRNA ligase subunit alpha [Candidatus Woesearchaeota archaeon]